MIDYNIGDEVTCVNDTKTRLRAAIDFQEWPVKGKSYTVRGFQENDGIVTGVLLEELHNKPIFIKLLGREIEPAFAAWRFKKNEKIVAQYSNYGSKKIKEVIAL